MELTFLLLQLFSGVVGGIVAGNLRATFSLGILCNSMAGIIGGLLGGQILQSLLGIGPSAGDADYMRSLLTSVGAGGIGGAIVVVVVGWLTHRQRHEES